MSRVGGDAQVKSHQEGLRHAEARARPVPRRSRRSRCSRPTSTQASRRQLARGARLTELLRQPQYSPYPVEKQVVSIWAGTNGKLDDVPVADVLRFESELLDYLERNTEVLDTLRETNVLDDDTAAALDDGVDEFTQEFVTGEGKPLARGKESAAERRRSRAERSSSRLADDVDQTPTTAEGRERMPERNSGSTGAHPAARRRPRRSRGPWS